jgi:hypothetical protein
VSDKVLLVIMTVKTFVNGAVTLKKIVSPIAQASKVGRVTRLYALNDSGQRLMKYTTNKQWH